MPRPVITLTTDFGLSDHFVGTMKGVILAICPTAEIVDISHGITPYEIPEGAFTISQAWPYFPKKTVHVVVVDPGVGTSRRPILVEAAGQYFIAPDNGVLSMLYSREKHKVRAINQSRYFLKEVSRTFHGRDIFAPSAAHLAAGAKPASFGKLVTDYMKREFEKPQRTGKRTWTGVVLKIDRFGNLITNFPFADFAAIETRPFQIAAGPQVTRLLARSYAEVSFGELFVIHGSSGYLELATNQASAAKMLGCAVGAPIELTLYA